MTDREQKINEMTKLVEAHNCDDVCVYCKYNGLKNCERLHDMETLYNAGYRKMDEVTLRLELGDRSAEEIKQIAEAFNGDIKKQVAKEIYDLIGLIPIPDKHGTHLHIGFENALSAVKIKIAAEYDLEVK